MQKIFYWPQAKLESACVMFSFVHFFDSNVRRFIAFIRQPQMLCILMATVLHMLYQEKLMLYFANHELYEFVRIGSSVWFIGSLMMVGAATIYICANTLKYLAIALMTFLVSLRDKPSLPLVLSQLHDEEVKPFLKHPAMEKLLKKYGQWYMEMYGKEETLMQFPQSWNNFDKVEKVCLKAFLQSDEYTLLHSINPVYMWPLIRHQNQQLNIEALDLD